MTPRQRGGGRKRGRLGLGHVLLGHATPRGPRGLAQGQDGMSRRGGRFLGRLSKESNVFVKYFMI